MSEDLLEQLRNKANENGVPPCKGCGFGAMVSNYNGNRWFCLKCQGNEADLDKFFEIMRANAKTIDRYVVAEEMRYDMQYNEGLLPSQNGIKPDKPRGPCPIWYE